jgi:multicomponent Na+:H+ antiporter subunit D
MTIVPLIIAVPLATAALIVVFGRWLSNELLDLAGAGAALASAVLAGILLSRTAHRTVVYWFGGWRPRTGQFPLGISFTVDRFGAGLALFAFALAASLLVYSWHYLQDAHYLYEVLVLLFAAGMAGFALSGDLFNMFVFFELMSVAAYALTAYRVEEEPALQAAFNFGASNSIGSFLVVLGLGLLYGRTGSLNLAELGRRLDVGHRHDGLVVTAFVLILCGFLVKSAIAPFHFWLADAYAAAPAPICVLFAAVMSDLGLYAIGRVYWTTFEGALGAFHADIRVALLVLGAVSALLGAVMCVLQRHLKRLLAYATISELGCVLMGVALLTPDGAAGAALTVISHGLAAGALFFAAGLLLIVLGDVDELVLYGKGRRLPFVALAWLLATIALAGPPFVGAFTGHALIGDAANSVGAGWVPPVIALATLVTTGVTLRAGIRVFVGLGDREDPLLTQEPRESPGARESPSVGLMTAITLLLAVAGIATGASTGLAVAAKGAATGFVDHGAYLAAVLQHRAAVHVPEERWTTTASSLVWSLVATAGSIVGALFGLYRSRLPRSALGALAAVARPLQAVHSGHVGDYVAWLTFGVALLGGVFALTLR